MILIGGLVAGFCLLWVLCMQMILAYRSSAPVFEAAATVQTQSLEFPFSIPGTTLIAEQLVSYDGLFSEGEGAYDVTNVAALLLYNYGDQGIDRAQVCLRAGCVQYAFVFDTVPAGARILVPEQNALEYAVTAFQDCTGYQSTDPSDWHCTDRILLTYPDMGAVSVTNLTEEKLTGIYLKYKTYYSQGDFFVGGKTEIFYIRELKPNENIQVYPNNYAFGYSGFVQITIASAEDIYISQCR